MNNATVTSSVSRKHLSGRGSWRATRSIPRQITRNFTNCSPWPLRFCSNFAYVLPYGPYYLPVNFGFQGHRGHELWVIKILRFHRTLQYKIIFISAAIGWIIKTRISLKSAWAGGSNKNITKALRAFRDLVTSWPFLDTVTFQIFPIFKIFIFLLKDVSYML